MTFSYYPAQTDKGQKYARLYSPKNIDSELSCQITFSELQYQKTDTHYLLTGAIQSHTTGIKENFKEKAVKGETVIIRLLNIPEHTTTWKGESKTAKQSVLEKYLCGRFDILDITKAYSGTIRFRFDGMLNYLIEGKLDGAMAIEQHRYAMELVEVPKSFELEEVKAGSVGGAKNYKSEKDKKSELMAYKLEQLSAVMNVPLPDYKSLLEFVSSGGSDIVEFNLNWLDKLTR